MNILKDGNFPAYYDELMKTIDQTLKDCIMYGVTKYISLSSIDYAEDEFSRGPIHVYDEKDKKWI